MIRHSYIQTEREHLPANRQQLIHCGSLETSPIAFSGKILLIHGIADFVSAQKKQGKQVQHLIKKDTAQKSISQMEIWEISALICNPMK